MVGLATFASAIGSDRRGGTCPRGFEGHAQEFRMFEASALGYLAERQVAASRTS